AIGHRMYQGWMIGASSTAADSAQAARRTGLEMSFASAKRAMMISAMIWKMPTTMELTSEISPPSAPARLLTSQPISPTGAYGKAASPAVNIASSQPNQRLVTAPISSSQVRDMAATLAQIF